MRAFDSLCHIRSVCVDIVPLCIPAHTPVPVYPWLRNKRGLMSYCFASYHSGIVTLVTKELYNLSANSISYQI